MGTTTEADEGAARAAREEEDAQVVEMLSAMRPSANKDAWRLFMEGKLGSTPYIHVSPDELRRAVRWSNARQPTATPSDDGTATPTVAASR